MNFQAIVLVNLFGVLLLTSLLISYSMTRQRRRLDDKLFMTITILAIAASIVEVVTFFVDGHPGIFYRMVNLLGNTFLYLTNSVGCCIWTSYVDLKLYRDKKRLRRMLPIYGAIPALAMLALIINLFTGFLLYIDEANVYHRTNMCTFLYLMVLLSGGLSVIIFYNYERKHEKVAFFPVWTFMLPVVAGSLVQGKFYGISTAWPATALGIAALYMSLQNEKSFIDPLTGHYNRLFLEHTLTNAEGGGKKYYGIMLDLNFFKKINDTYGHSAGDRALSNAGQILRRSVFIKGSIFRYAGDEFVIMLETDNERDVLAVEKRIREESEAFNAETKEPYKLSFSMGHAKLEKTDTEDVFLKKIDDAMYEDKERMHAQRT